MSTLSPRALASLQAYRLMLFSRTLHPEFFDIRKQRSSRSGQYDLETWLSRGAHIITFRKDEECVIEVLTPRPGAMPGRGRIHEFPCAGERDFESRFGSRLNYITSVQTEIVSENLYLATLKEMHEHAIENGSLMHRWREEDCRLDSLSVLDVQCYPCEAHAQSWHLDAGCGLVLRSQAVFEVLAEKAA
ncbi:MAG: hypothetical protein KJZ69_00680 [Phycisphaerales bacterium]|nr:hypothetical protein [Phycisphaerales bacterium]